MIQVCLWMALATGIASNAMLLLGHQAAGYIFIGSMIGWAIGACAYMVLELVEK